MKEENEEEKTMDINGKDLDSKVNNENLCSPLYESNKLPYEVDQTLGGEQQLQDEIFPTPLQVASIGIRFLAFMIDHFVIVMLTVLAPLLFSARPNGAGVLFILIVAFFLYACRDMIKGQSLGKFILGIAVREQEDSHKIPSSSKLFKRNLFVFIWFIDFFVLLSRKIKIGDKLAKTNVYRLDKKPRLFTRLGIFFLIPITLILGLVIMNIGREPLSAEEFTLRMEAEGFEVRDISYQFEDSERVELVLAVSSDYFSLEFAIFYTNRYALMAYSGNRDALERASRHTSSSHSHISMPNFNRYAITFAGSYIVVSRIENTFIYVETSRENRSDMNRILRMLGY